MSFMIKTAIKECPDFQTFLKDYAVGQNDLIITNEYVVKPHCKSLPCDAIFQEQYGSGEPTDEMVDKMLMQVNNKEYERIIAIGGGTVIDIAKLFVFSGGLNCEEIFAQGAALPKARKLIVLPTTCGTGSEVTNISIISFEKKQTKVGLAIPALFPDEAVLIGSMLSTLPFEVFATSSIDALILAVESYVSPKANSFTRALGKEAIRLILEGYQALIKTRKSPKELPADMTPFLAASTMAGAAFGNAGCAAVHALSYPIGSVYHVPHGKANYLVFEAVYSAYAKKGADLSPLEAVLSQVLACPMGEVWKALFKLVDSLLPRQPLREIGMDETQCAEMAASVIKNQQRLLGNNPIELSESEIAGIYKTCL